MGPLSNERAKHTHKKDDVKKEEVSSKEELLGKKFKKLDSKSTTSMNKLFNSTLRHKE